MIFAIQSQFFHLYEVLKPDMTYRTDAAINIIILCLIILYLLQKYPELLDSFIRMRKIIQYIEDEYRTISADYARQLSPKTGALLARIDLICEPKRVMNSTGKEGKSLENPTN